MINKDMVKRYMLDRSMEIHKTISDICIKSDDWIITYDEARCYVNYRDSGVIKSSFIIKEQIDNYISNLRDENLNKILE